LALFASAGGFLVPILTSSGSGSHIVLFAYYVLLNIGIFIVAWYRSWRVLNLLGFVCTFVIATAWGVLRYRPDFFATTEPFLIIFFLMYLAISVLFTMKHPYTPKNLVDGTLTFGLPLVAFPLQVSLVRTFAYGEAVSALVLSLLYAGLYIILRHKERTALLAQSFLALAVVFFTIMIPYLFDDDVSAALWSLEGTAIIWISLRQKRVLARYFGMILLLVSSMLYMVSIDWDSVNIAEYLGALIVVVSMLISAWLIDRHKEEIDRFSHKMAYLFMGIALFLWMVATPSQLGYFGEDAYLLALIIAALLSAGAAQLLKWNTLRMSLEGFIVLGALLFYLSKNTSLYALHPFSGYGLWVFAGLVGVQYLLLWRYDAVWKHTGLLHLFTFWFVVSVLTFEAHYDAMHHFFGASAEAIGWGIVPLLSLGVILSIGRYLGKYRQTYLGIGAGGLVFFLMLWEIWAFRVPSSNSDDGYIAVLNPIDMIQIAVWAAVGYWVYRERKSWSQTLQTQAYGLLGIVMLLLLSTLFARYVHAVHGVPYTMKALWHSDYFETGMSLIWSAVAIVAMLLSKKFHRRTLWMAGFGLLLVVVLKLFFVELAHSGTIERIISFIVVGVLLLLIGYFVPMPPTEEKERSK
jgi:uncharacterized membrane protein